MHEKALKLTHERISDIGLCQVEKCEKIQVRLLKEKVLESKTLCIFLCVSNFF